MYDGDSFFTLSALGQLGLALLSLFLGALTLWLAWLLGSGQGLVIRLCIAAFILILFVWLSPQIYYTYYMMLFDGLPIQSVIKSPPSPLALMKVLAFADRPTLSAHSKGLLGWTLLIAMGLRPWIAARLQRGAA